MKPCLKRKTEKHNGIQFTGIASCLECYETLGSIPSSVKKDFDNLLEIIDYE